MSTKHTKTKKESSNFSKTDIGIIESVPTDENIVDSTPVKKSKEKGRVPFYIKALDNLSIETKALKESELGVINTADNTIFDEALDKNDIVYGHDLKFPEKDAQVVQSRQSPEGSYESIWKKPKIRPNIEFEEEGFDLDEEFGFDEDEEEEDCAMEAPSLSYKRFITTSTSQPETPPPLKVIRGRYIPPLSPEEELPEDVLQVKDICSDPSEYVEVTDDLHKTICEMKKEPLMGNIELFNASLNAMGDVELQVDTESATEIQEDISKLRYIKKKERITDEPINEV